MRPNGVPFYVGKGKGGRYKIGRRNNYYNRIIDKYGAENIRIKILHCRDEREAFSLEITYIKKLLKRGYKLANLTSGGEGLSNPSEETRRKIALGGAKRRGRVVSDATKEKMRLAQLALKRTFKHTEEARKKIILAQLGRKLPKKWCENIAKAKVGHEPWLAKTPEALANQRDGRRGVKNTLEHNAKISASKMGHAVSEEQRQKFIARITGRKHTPEEIAKQIVAQKGRKNSPEATEKSRQGLLKYFAEKRELGIKIQASPETKAKMSESHKRRYAEKKAAGIEIKFSAESRAKMSTSQKAYQARKRAEKEATSQI
jgi:hypothetical protein